MKKDKLFKEILDQLNQLYDNDLICDLITKVPAPKKDDVSKYIDGYKKFSKNLLLSNPFLKQTLPKILLRDFYKKSQGL